MSQIRTLAALGVALTLGGVVAAGITVPQPGRAASQPDTVTAAAAQSVSTGTLGRHVRPGGAVTREQIIKRAQSWVKQEVPYSQTAWWPDKATGGPYRQDCSGFVSMAWQLPTSDTTLTLPRRAHPIAVKDLKPGDILNSSGHVILFGAWTDQAKGTFTFYQASRSGYPANKSTGSIHAARLAGHPTHRYTALRYKNVTESAPAATKPSRQAPPAATPSRKPPRTAPVPAPQDPKTPTTTGPTAKPTPAPARGNRARALRLSTIVTAQNILYARSADGSGVYQWTGRGTAWAKVGGPARHLYGGGAGLFATNPHTGNIYRYDPAHHTWTGIGGPGKSFVMDATRLYGLSPDGSGIYQWTGKPGQWTKIWDHTRNVYGGPAGLFATNPGNGNIYRYHSATRSWSLTGGPGKTFATDGRHLYGLSPDGSGVYQWTGRGTAWVKVGGPARHLYGGGAGLFATNPHTGNIYRYDPNARGWSLTGGPGKTFATDGKHLYGLSPDGSGVYRWTGSGTTWTGIGAPTPRQP
ncbi:hypothetical protein [Streptomyces sp. NPDC096030]|uniref:hypothetical protein n=1 Tax=Streptomyces sp. NPDC096030 TaxID=3155423 RepID=UPI00331E08B6